MVADHQDGGPSRSSVSESTPLMIAEPIPIDDSALPDDANGFCASSTGHGKSDDTPLPMKQILILCYARIVEPIAYFGIFPFVNQMIEEVGGIKQENVGFYSGLIESCFSFTQMMLMLAWGRAADRYGRKPILVFSLFGVAFATAIFGLGKSIPQMVMLRCSAGIFAGTIVTVRAMISENSTQKTQARAFSLFAFSGNLGIFIGPLIGGTLSSPAKNIPSVFGNIKFFKDYPYALPTFVTGCVGLSAAIICGLFVKETLKKKLKGDTAVVEPPMSVLDLLKTPDVPYVLFLFGHVMLLGLAYTAVTPVFWYTSVELGGFGFSPMQISSFIAGAGLSQSVWLLVIFPPLQARWTTRGVLKACYLGWPFFFASAPFCNWLLRRGWTTAFWIVAPILLATGSGAAMAFTAVQLALNDVSPSPATFGTMTGMALTLTSGLRTVGPAAFTSLFAYGMNTQLLDGYLVWAVLIALALMGTVLIRWYPDPKEEDD